MNNNQSLEAKMKYFYSKYHLVWIILLSIVAGMIIVYDAYISQVPPKDTILELFFATLISPLIPFLCAVGMIFWFNESYKYIIKNSSATLNNDRLLLKAANIITEAIIIVAAISIIALKAINTILITGSTIGVGIFAFCFFVGTYSDSRKEGVIWGMIFLIISILLTLTVIVRFISIL